MSAAGADIRVLDGGHAVVASIRLVNDGDYLIGRDAASSEIALPDASVSRRHCLVRLEGGRFQVRDAGSTNGSRLGRRRLGDAWVSWEIGEALHVGIYTLFLAESATDAVDPVDADRLAAVEPALRPSVAVAFPARQFVEPVVAIEDLRASGHVVEEADVLTIGGGAASFALVDALRIAGVTAGRIRVLASSADPLERLALAFRALGAAPEARLRSASAARLDNPWGAPGYGASEAWTQMREGRPGAALALLGQLAAGSTLATPYGPSLDLVRESLARESERIGWPDMLRPGRALALRRTDDGRFAVAWRVPVGEAEGEARNRFLVAAHVHLATGWSGWRLTPLLEAFRRRHRANPRAAGALEPHDTLYTALEAEGGTVAVLGAGFEAARVLERLVTLRRLQRNVTILRIGQPEAVQDDIWPAGAWAGSQAAQYAAAAPSIRADLARHWTAPSIPEREDWLSARERGEREGWLRRLDGPAVALALDGESVVVELPPVRPGGEPVGVAVDHVIDCGMQPVDPLAQPFLRDLVATYALPLHPAVGGLPGLQQPGLAVDDAFAIPALANGRGIAFASGIAAAGGAFGPVDSFLGHVMAARAMTTELLPALGLAVPGPKQSLVGWFRWMRGAAP